mmetsp:Transcript_74701/g.211336  ORF Transcript_74701/g.211336 Transcript_74701/m.211336 type:complete len:222 (-) Transcript_74701:1203-1868(-)
MNMISLIRSLMRGMTQSYGVKQRRIPSPDSRNNSSQRRPSKWMTPTSVSRSTPCRPSRACAKAMPHTGTPLPTKKRGGGKGPAFLLLTFRASPAGVRGFGLRTSRPVGSSGTPAVVGVAVALVAVLAAVADMTTFLSLVSVAKWLQTTCRNCSSVFTAQQVYLRAPGPRLKVLSRLRGRQRDASSVAALACHQSSPPSGFVMEKTYHIRTFLRRRRSIASI